MEDLINCFLGWQVDVLDDICTVDECRVYKVDVEMRIGKTGGGGRLFREHTDRFWKVARGDYKDILFVLEFVELS